MAIPLPKPPYYYQPLHMFRIVARFAWIPLPLNLTRNVDGIVMRADRWVWLRKFYYIEELRNVGWRSDGSVKGWEKHTDWGYLKREEADSYLRESKGLVLHKDIYRKP